MLDPKSAPVSKEKLAGSIFPWLQREILNAKPLDKLQQPASVVIETIHQYTHPNPEPVQPTMEIKRLVEPLKDITMNGVT